MICQETFQNLSLLRRHAEDTHSVWGKCPICGITKAHEKRLRDHVRKVHLHEGTPEEKEKALEYLKPTVVCKICGADYNSAKLLQRHVVKCESRQKLLGE